MLLMWSHRSRVTYKGCINYGKPKTEWRKASGEVEGESNTQSNQAPSGASTAAPPMKLKKGEEEWINSKAKEMLRNDIIAGKVTSKSLQEIEIVHQSHQEYAKWPLKNFKTNLKNLLEAIALDYQRMAEDAEAYGHDIALLQELQLDDLPEPTPWHKSDAKAFYLRTLMLESMKQCSHLPFGRVELPTWSSH
jgi:hypothetical protein